MLDPLTRPLSRTRFLAALEYLDTISRPGLLAEIDVALAAMPGGTPEQLSSKKLAQSLFAEGQCFHRENPIFGALIATRLISNAQLDEAWGFAQWLTYD